MTQCADTDLSTRKYRERELYTIPISSSWFRWDEIHDLERRSLPEFFDGGSYSRSPRVYKEYRDFIINKYREDPSRRLTFTDVRKSLVGDIGTLRKVFLFLEKWGLINFSASDEKRLRRSEDDGRPVVIVEVDPAAGVRVVPAPTSSSSFTAAEQAGGEGGLKLPPLSSYSDAFGESKPGSGLICAFCGRCRLGLNESQKDGILLCSECANKNTNDRKSDVDSMPINHSDSKDQSSWTDAETLLLLEAVLKLGDDWDLIAQHVRTKTKLECISKLINLPFGDHLLGPTNTKSSCTNLITPLEENTSNSEVINGNSTVLGFEDGDQQVELEEIKEEGGETDGQDCPLKRICFSPFSDTMESFMKQVALLSTANGTQVAAVAVDAAMRALCQENPCASGIKVDDEDTMVNKQLAFASEKSFGATTFQVRAAMATTLAAAAARATLIADQEEREMELLMASIIQAQLKKLQYKMKQLREIELIMEKEYDYIQQRKKLILEEWFDLLNKLFDSGIPRWRDQPFSRTFLQTFPL